VATAGVAGALIGLLFVAISVAQDRLISQDDDPVHQVRASAALTAFTNALAISLFALIPSVGISWVAVSFGIVGVLFIAGSLMSLLRERRAHRAALRDATPTPPRRPGFSWWCASCWASRAPGSSWAAPRSASSASRSCS
jgi:hypothetical protein